MSLSEELERLHRLREAGALTEEEFAAAKARLLSETREPDSASRTRSVSKLRERLQDGRFWAMILHLSLMLNLVLPGLALVVPFLIWQLGKERFPELDDHGKNAANFVISYAIYAAILGVIGFLFSFLPLIGNITVSVWYAFGAVVALLVFYVALQANQGRLTSYPLAIRFLI